MSENQGKYGFSTLSVDPMLLKPSPWNPNVVSPDNEKKLEESIKKLGFFKPALVRELKNGSFEIVGGEHRIQAAMRLGHTEVPIINLGKIDDTRAKELCLLDNGRYGQDDAAALAVILEEIGKFDDVSTFMPFSSQEIDNIFASVDIAMGEIGMGADDDEPMPLPSAKPKAVQEFQIMRFKVPVEDASAVQAAIDSIMKTQGFTAEESLTNAGHALVHLANKFGE